MQMNYLFFPNMKLNICTYIYIIIKNNIFSNHNIRLHFLIIFNFIFQNINIIAQISYILIIFNIFEKINLKIQKITSIILTKKFLNLIYLL